MDLVQDQHLVASAIAACPPDAVAANLGGDQAAGFAVVAGVHRLTDLAPDLAGLLDDDGLAARTAAWSLGVIGAYDILLTIITGGSLDQREQGYAGLATLAATALRSGGAAALPDGFDAAVRKRLDDEIARAQSGRTGLCEHATRVLAIIGTDGFDDLVQQVIEADPYTDRFELQRQRKAVSADSRDRESADEYAADWPQRFADDLADETVTEDPADDEDQAEAPAPSETAAIDESHATRLMPAMDDAPAAAPDAPPPAEDDTEAPADDEPPEGTDPLAVDWEAFSQSDVAAAADPQIIGMLLQLGPALEQLAQRAAGISLLALQAEELAGLILQVLPQALPPQVVQAALSPQAINGFQSLAGWLDQQDGASGQLVEGIRIVRQALQEQVRASGMLGGPDYAEPEPEAAPE